MGKSKVKHAVSGSKHGEATGMAGESHAGGHRSAKKSPVTAVHAPSQTSSSAAKHSDKGAGSASAGHRPQISPSPSVILAGADKVLTGLDITEKVKELVKLAQEQGYLTYTDINDALPDSVVTPEELDALDAKPRE